MPPGSKPCCGLCWRPGEHPTTHKLLSAAPTTGRCHHYPEGLDHEDIAVTCAEQTGSSPKSTIRNHTSGYNLSSCGLQRTELDTCDSRTVTLLLCCKGFCFNCEIRSQLYQIGIKALDQRNIIKCLRQGLHATLCCICSNSDGCSRARR